MDVIFVCVVVLPVVPLSLVVKSLRPAFAGLFLSLHILNHCIRRSFAILTADEALLHLIKLNI